MRICGKQGKGSYKHQQRANTLHSYSDYSVYANAFRLTGSWNTEDVFDLQRHVEVTLHSS